jgi:hypothetical protein
LWERGAVRSPCRKEGAWEAAPRPAGASLADWPCQGSATFSEEIASLELKPPPWAEWGGPAQEA